MWRAYSLTGRSDLEKNFNDRENRVYTNKKENRDNIQKKKNVCNTKSSSPYVSKERRVVVVGREPISLQHTASEKYRHQNM